jgi:hypothetical protein
MSDDLGAIAELGGAAAVELAASTLTEHGRSTATCRNCGAPLFGAYCSVCGQERETHRRSVLGLVHELFSEITSFDSRILRTVVALLFRPGELALAFHEGRTRRYMPAVRLYLFASLLFFLTMSLTGIALVQIQLREVPNAYFVKALPHGGVVVVANGNGEGGPIPAVAAHRAAELSPGPHTGLSTKVFFFAPLGGFRQNISAQGWAQIAETKKQVLHAVGNDKHGWMARNALAMVEKLARDPAALNGPLTVWIPRLFFLLLPLFALLLALFYVRQRRKFLFVDHLVFSLSVHSFVFALLIVALGAAQVLPGGVVARLFFFAMAAYVFLALKRFYGQRWAMTAVKFIALSVVYSVFFLLPGLLLVLATGIIEG